jgi:sugar lactone lactonase YvrE
MRIELTAGATATVVGRVPSANGVAFEDDGHLLVCNYGGGSLLRLTLVDGVETERATIASRLGSPDGVAVDRDGTIYVTDNGAGRLLQLQADGTSTELLTGISSAASIEFGAGVLDCEDLYVASGRALRRYEGTVPGRAVPWH